MVSQQIRSLFREFRKQSPFMLVGHNAELALSAAKTLTQWRRLEKSGKVRLKVVPDNDPDPSFYDTWEHISDRTRSKLKEEYCDSCVGVVAEFICSCCGQWKTADSIFGCAGYKNPASPFENCYVIGMMNSAIEALD